MAGSVGGPHYRAPLSEGGGGFMVAGRTLACAAIVVVMVACFDSTADSPAGPSVSPPPPGQQFSADLNNALAALRRHAPKLLEIPGVVGTAVTGFSNGRAGVLVLVERAGIAGLPQALDGVPVRVWVSGRIMAFSDPTQRQRPAPMGFSVGHPAITAGSKCGRLRGGPGCLRFLSPHRLLRTSHSPPP